MSTTLTCPHCGTPQTMAITLAGVTLAGNRHNFVTRCRQCGRTFDAAPDDGTYSTVDGQLRRVANYLAHADLAVLVDLQRRLTDAQRSHDAEAATEVLAAVGVAPGGGLRSQANRMELWTVLALLAAVVAVLIGQRSSSTNSGVTHEDVVRIIEQLEEQQPDQAGAQQHGSHSTPRKMGRNELCWCGSGVKYKRCHGAPSQHLR